MSDVSLGPTGLLAYLLLLDWISLLLITFVPGAYFAYLLLAKTNLQHFGRAFLSIVVGIGISYLLFPVINNLFNLLLMNIHNIIPGIIPPLIVVVEIVIIFMYYRNSPTIEKKSKRQKNK